MTATLMLNLAWLSFVQFDVVLLWILLAAFPLWVALAFYCYHVRTSARAWAGLGVLAVPSIVINAVMYAT
ncbi:hypothetical protein [Solilutibacter pythonis]|uniref:hypothetical protein n=1 Tax=Solilutibacter pythonis TaxID=2483112 RepID=UPI001314C06E|nr:hypothetical protein [Lysobacter pythonis]